MIPVRKLERISTKPRLVALTDAQFILQDNSFLAILDHRNLREKTKYILYLLLIRTHIQVVADQSSIQQEVELIQVLVCHFRQSRCTPLTFH